MREMHKFEQIILSANSHERMFQEEEKSDTSLKNLFLRSLLEWSQQFMDVDYLSFMNMLGG